MGLSSSFREHWSGVPGHDRDETRTPASMVESTNHYTLWQVQNINCIRMKIRSIF